MAAAFFIGAVPFSWLVARATGRVNMKKMAAGTISGTALYNEAGFFPLVAAGLLDLGKGILVVELFRYDGELVRTLALAAAVAGHNWSPYLRGAGGRGVAPTLGGMGFTAWPAVLWLGGMFGLGRVLKRSGIFVFFGYLFLPLLVFLTSCSDTGFHSGESGNVFNLTHHPLIALGTLAIVGVVFVKRGLGNKADSRVNRTNWCHRLLYDNEPDQRT